MTTTRRTLLARTALAAPAGALAAIPALSSGGDPAAEIGRALARAWGAYGAADEVGDTAREAESSELIDRLEDALPLVQARTLPGCVAQLVLAHTDVESLEDCPNPERAAALARRISRCLYSVVRALEERSFVPRVEVAGDRYMPARLDPRLAAAGRA